MLFSQADEKAKIGDLELADRYVRLARAIGMRHTIRLPRDLKRKFCKHCYGYLGSAERCRVRVNSNMGRVEVKCLNCSKSMYFPTGKKK